MDKIFEWLIALLFVAALFLMVRPGSQGPKLVQTATDGTVNLVKAATGGGSW